MTQLPPPQRPDQQAYPLNYASPEANRPVGGVGFAGQVALGFAAFVAAVIVGTVITAIIGNTVPQADTSMLLGPVIAMAALIYLTVTAHGRWRWKGFLIGVLGTLGLILLAVGLCFVVVFSLTR